MTAVQLAAVLYGLTEVGRTRTLSEVEAATRRAFDELDIPEPWHPGTLEDAQPVANRVGEILGRSVPMKD